MQFRRPVAGVLAEACEIAAFPQDKKLEYEKEMLSERDIQAICSYAHDEGERKGKAESQREIASALKAKGIDSDTISACTGLSADEVSKL